MSGMDTVGRTPGSWRKGRVTTESLATGLRGTRMITLPENHPGGPSRQPWNLKI